MTKRRGKGITKVSTERGALGAWSVERGAWSVGSGSGDGASSNVEKWTNRDKPQVLSYIAGVKSPFPGMDPYLEARWGDVHQSLITYARDALQPNLPPDLRARVEERVFVQTE